ncbi:MAG: tRNA lysidine(34) synthetase TilS [Oscillospiraceae bacterium]|nr:tRNA lysidine(34) synthetase TilS [Oscillospiraceae bacterium]
MRPLDAVRDFLRREEITGRVCCALSGGADSVCLLVCLTEMPDITISAVHIQHNLRGGESRRDEDFCRDFCQSRGIPLTVIPVDVQGYAAEHSVSIETAARECRYAAFETLDCDWIATAHTASDQLETVLFRMARGTGLRGLCGIPQRRDRYIRPLLNVTRGEVEEFLRRREISFVTDSTNLSDDYSRNFVRHHIVPEMKHLNPGAEQNTARMVDSLREDAALLDSLADTAYAECLHDGTLTGLGSLHPAIQCRCIARFLSENRLPHGFEAVTAVQTLLARGGTLDLDRSGTIVRYGRGVLFTEKIAEKSSEMRLRIGENQLFPGHILSAEVILRENSDVFSSVHKKFTDFVLDYDIIKGYVMLHGRKPGLYLRSHRRGYRIRIKKWMNAEIPPAKRQYVHFLSDELGLIWAEGLGADERVRVTDATQRMLVLHVHTDNTGCT